MEVKITVKKTAFYYLFYAMTYLFGNRSLITTYINGKKAKTCSMNDLMK